MNVEKDSKLELLTTIWLRSVNWNGKGDQFVVFVGYDNRVGDQVAYRKQNSKSVPLWKAHRPVDCSVAPVAINSCAIGGARDKQLCVTVCSAAQTLVVSALSVLRPDTGGTTNG